MINWVFDKINDSLASDNFYIINQRDEEHIYLQQWLDKIVKRTKHKVISIYIQSLDHQRDIRKQIQQYFMKSHAYGKIQRQWDILNDHYEKEDVILSKIEQKIQLCDGIRDLSLQNISGSKCIELSNTDKIINYMTKYFPQNNIIVKKFFKDVVICKIDKVKMMIQYSGMQQAKAKLQQLYPFIKQSTDIIIKNIESTQNLKKTQKIQAWYENYLYKHSPNNNEQQYYVGSYKRLNIHIKNKQAVLKEVFFILKNRIINKAIVNMLKYLSILKILKIYTFNIIKENQLKQINSKIKAHLVHQSFKQIIKHQNLKNLNKYLKTLTFHLRFQKINRQKVTNQLNKYFKTLSLCRAYKNNEVKYKIRMIQSNIRSFIIKKSQYFQVQQQYQRNNLIKQQFYNAQYEQFISNINKKMRQKSMNNSHSSFDLKLQILEISSWGLVEMFNPKIIMNLFQKAISYGKVIKIIIIDNEIVIFLENGRCLRYGFRYPQRKQKQKKQSNHKNQHQIIDTIDKSFSYIIDQGKELYSKGSNNHGQLGLGHKLNTNQYCRVLMKSKIKLISTKNYHTTCITQNNEIYYWGSSKGNLKQSDIPVKLCINIPKNTSIMRLNSSLKSTFVVLSNGEIHQITTSKRILRNTNRKPQQSTKKYQSIKRSQSIKSIKSIKSLNQTYQQSNHEKSIHKGVISSSNFRPYQLILITTGGYSLQITFLIKIRFNCYDSVKRKSILRWFSQDKQDKMTDQSILICSSNHCCEGEENIRYNQ